MTHTDRPGGDSGFTLIETVVAALILAVGVVATFTVLVSSDHLNLTTQQVQAQSTVAEQTLEQDRALPYASLALSSLPTHAAAGNAAGDTSGDPVNPDYWVSGTNLLVVTSFNSVSSPALTGVSVAGEPLISGGAIATGPVTVSSDGFTESVYTFVSWVNDRCVYLLVDLCPGTQDAKRLAVAVVPAGTTEKPYWLTTVVANPRAGVAA